MNIIMIGPQGCGKGTQAKLMVEKYNFKHISTGDIFRKGVKEGDETALKMKAHVDAGNLFPDELAMELIKKNLSETGNIFDGVPRTLPQAEALDDVANIDLVIELRLSDEEAVRRISGRRQDKDGNIFSIFNLPEGVKEEDLIQRDDDKPDAVKKRLAKYRDATEPLLEFYKPRNIVNSVDASKPIEDIFKDICQIIESSAE